jgi:lipopolysaccharide export system protein LptA
MMKSVCVFLSSLTVLALLTATSYGVTTSSKPITGNHDNNAPINISADNFQADLNAKSGTYTGNVIVIQGDTKLRANQVRILTIDGKADRIFAAGNVVVDSPQSGIATGDNGVYSVGPRIVVMTGNVVLKKGTNVMRGSKMTVNLVTGLANLSPGIKTPGNPTGRVQGVFTPNSQTQ